MWGPPRPSSMQKNGKQITGVTQRIWPVLVSESHWPMGTVTGLVTHHPKSWSSPKGYSIPRIFSKNTLCFLYNQWTSVPMNWMERPHWFLHGLSPSAFLTALSSQNFDLVRDHQTPSFLNTSDPWNDSMQVSLPVLPSSSVLAGHAIIWDINSPIAKFVHGPSP